MICSSPTAVRKGGITGGRLSRIPAACLGSRQNGHQFRFSMKNTSLHLALVTSLTLSGSLLACRAKDHEHPDRVTVNARVVVPQSANPRQQNGKEPWVGVHIEIGAEERAIITEYGRKYHGNLGEREDHDGDRGSKHKHGLPPGLQKKVARGGSLPPGWQKKCQKGEVLPVEVFEKCTPLPKEVIVKLPPPPQGTILVTIDGKVVRLLNATREILDVFDVKF